MKLSLNTSLQKVLQAMNTAILHTPVLDCRPVILAAHFIQV